MMAQPKIDRRGWLAWWLQKRRRSRGAIVHLVAPTLVIAGAYFQGTASVPASVWQFAQSDSYYESGPIQTWVDGADESNAGYDLLPPNQAESGRVYSYCTCRYQVAGVWSPWCAVI